MPEFEFIYTETLKSKTYIKANSEAEARKMFEKGEYDCAGDIEFLDKKIEEVKEYNQI